MRNIIHVKIDESGSTPQLMMLGYERVACQENTIQVQIWPDSGTLSGSLVYTPLFSGSWEEVTALSGLTMAVSVPYSRIDRTSGGVYFCYRKNNTDTTRHFIRVYDFTDAGAFLPNVFGKDLIIEADTGDNYHAHMQSTVTTDGTNAGEGLYITNINDLNVNTGKGLSIDKDDNTVKVNTDKGVTVDTDTNALTINASSDDFTFDEETGALKLANSGDCIFQLQSDGRAVAIPAVLVEIVDNFSQLRVPWELSNTGQKTMQWVFQGATATKYLLKVPVYIQNVQVTEQGVTYDQGRVTYQAGEYTIEVLPQGG